ncbi:hypothetical protein IFM89_032524 [Coptis chinensis]|uniref:VOC domain-containing protein n=1 Tax=Coptis chinensis TaxID=261450 RepID=A0A835IP96_9MAGN|nr:hypothetical protein IFM89_032524 [Coptis chinensis]
MAAAEGVSLNHISRESSDINRLANFYQEILGFERIEAPKLEFGVIWLKHPSSSLSLHLIERNPNYKLPEGPFSAATPGAVNDPEHLARGHHVAFGVTNYESFVQTLKDKGIPIFENRQPDGKTKQLFFFDPDGNGLEVGNWATAHK